MKERGTPELELVAPPAAGDEDSALLIAWCGGASAGSASRDHRTPVRRSRRHSRGRAGIAKDGRRGKTVAEAAQWRRCARNEQHQWLTINNSTRPRC